ncbi:MAG TPA: alpha/beta hydrolase [Candidatus Polarisedimenticolaceae bacterium]|nr:alpha/beta hydrolase [Candidatus Polarisedimenticolaceae bacterium]
MNSNPALRTISRVIIFLLIIGLLAALVIWVLWPVRQKSLQTAQVQHFSFAAAKAEVAKINQIEKAASVKPECYSKLYLHKQPTPKAVVMFHGVSACTVQFSGLAQYFYDKGYNVYAPLAPEHGRPDNLNHAKVSSQGLVDYVNTSVNITSALGDEVGAIGLSGGGNLATWAAQYRPEIRRLLALSPFYEPSVSQAPKWQIRPLLVLHGNNLISDQLNKPKDPQHALSYRALAKYVTIFKNLPDPAKDTHIKHIAMVMADDDHEIDQPLALATLESIAKANHITLVRDQLPADLHLGHDIISPDNDAVMQHQAFLHDKYFRLYEQ